MYMEVLVGVVTACDIMKWTTGVGVIGTRWADPGENTRNRQILVRGEHRNRKRLKSALSMIHKQL